MCGGAVASGREQGKEVGVLRVRLGVSEDFWDARNVLFLNLGVRVQITWTYSGCKSS